jgi:hypothetical protein
MIRTGRFPTGAVTAPASVTKIISGLFGTFEFASDQREYQEQIEIPIKAVTEASPKLIVKVPMTTFDGASFSAKKTQTLNAGDTLIVSDVVRSDNSNWIGGITPEGKKVYVPNATVTNLQHLAAAKRQVADVSFGGGEILAPADLSALQRAIASAGAGHVLGVSIRLQPPAAADKRYANVSSQLRLTIIRSALIELGVQKDIIGGIVEQSKSDLPENTARVTVASF